MGEKQTRERIWRHENNTGSFSGFFERPFFQAKNVFESENFSISEIQPSNLLKCLIKIVLQS